MTTDTERVSTSRTIAAPADRIFAVVAHPQGHVDIDGSGMLVAAPDAEPLRAIGDAFVMNMDREPLGDLPMGKYTVLNRVTRIEPDRLIEWSVGSQDHPKPLGHVYGYELVDRGDGTTEVTNYCDWSDLNPKLRDRITFPIVPVEMLARSLERLEQLVAEQG